MLPGKITSLRALPTLHAHELTTVTTNSSASWRLRLQIPIGPFGHYGGRLDRQGVLSGILTGWSGGILGAIHWRATLAGYSGILSRILGGMHWDALAGCSGGMLGGWAGSTGELGGIHWRAGPAHWRAWALSTGGLLWDTQRDTRRDALAGCSGGMLGGIGILHWRDTGQDPLASRAGSTGERVPPTGEPLWRDTGRYPLASCSNIKSNNPFLLGGEKRITVSGWFCRVADPCFFFFFLGVRGTTDHSAMTKISRWL